MPPGTEAIEPEFEALLHYIQESRGVDFRGYKKTSLRRRIARRMEEVAAEGFAAYHAFLEAHPQEFVELLNTVLINVTSFFRDPEAWDAVRGEVIPRLLSRDPGGEGRIRVWSVGCATGEEPYSLAMLFAEALGAEDFARRVKIYATDLDEAALRAARHATYVPRDVESVPPGLLETWFERTNNHYIVQRDLRKSVIFGRHNVVHDAPIGRIDLVVCRNLLIYLEAETQNQVLPRLHYALADGGLLFLGKAETQLARSKLFEPVDLRQRIFRKVPQEWRRSQGGGIAFAGHNGAPPDGHALPPQQARLLEAIADTSTFAYLALDMDGVLVFANAAARRLLEVGLGDLGRPFQDLPISYRPAELRTRIEEATRTGRTVRLEHQDHHRPPAEPIRLTVEVTPLFGRDGRQFATLLAFSDTTRIHRMQHELEAAQESLETHVEELQSANEELETTNEELQSTNEELETTNEELQSTNEELETMNEELRSANEELETANEALRAQHEEAAEYHSYSESILRSVDAGIAVLDQDLKVRSWNRWNENAWGLRAEEVQGHEFLALDIGLPVGRLRRDLLRVLAAETPGTDLTVEALDRRGRALNCRVRLAPLLYEARAPRGVVLIVEDVTEATQEREYTRYLGRVIGQSLNEVYFLDSATLRFTLINRGAEEKLGYSIAQLRQMAITDLMPGASFEALRALIAPVLAGERPEMVFETVMRARDGRDYPAEICVQHFAREQPPILVAMVHDISDRRHFAAAE